MRAAKPGCSRLRAVGGLGHTVPPPLPLPPLDRRLAAAGLCFSWPARLARENSSEMA